MLLEIAIAVIALAFAILVGFLVPTLIQLKKTVAESRRLVMHLDAEVPGLVKEVRSVAENVGAMADQARGSVEHAALLLHAVGEVGESVQHVHNAVRTRSGTFLVKLASVLAGVKAASTVVKERVHKDIEGHLYEEGGDYNGKR